MKRGRAKADYSYLAVPAATQIFAAPFAVLEPADPSDPFSWLPFSWLFAPFWIGLLAAPGYISAWLAVRRGHVPPGPKRWFATGSVAVGLGCACAGAVLAAFTIVGGILSLWSALLALLLLLRLNALSRAESDAAIGSASVRATRNRAGKD